MKYKNGDKYIGGWKDDKEDGKGIYYYANGDNCEGDWRAGKGKGMMLLGS